MDLSSACTFTSASAPVAGAKDEELQGTATATSFHTGSPPLLCPAASLCEEGLKDKMGLMQPSLSRPHGTLMVGEWPHAVKALANTNRVK